LEARHVGPRQRLEVAEHLDVLQVAITKEHDESTDFITTAIDSGGLDRHWTCGNRTSGRRPIVEREPDRAEAVIATGLDEHGLQLLSKLRRTRELART